MTFKEFFELRDIRDRKELKYNYVRVAENDDGYRYASITRYSLDYADYTLGWYKPWSEAYKAFPEILEESEAMSKEILTSGDFWL